MDNNRVRQEIKEVNDNKNFFPAIHRKYNKNHKVLDF